MALLPDLATAALYAVVLFLLALGFLVVFAESVRLQRAAVAFAGSLVVATGLVLLGEAGLAFLAAGFGLAFIGALVFERLTMR